MSKGLSHGEQREAASFIAVKNIEVDLILRKLDVAQTSCASGDSVQLYDC